MADHDTHDHTGVPGVTPAEVTAIPTSETDTTKRLRPDGAGATEWVAASGSGGDAADIGFDPTGLDNTTATDVQAALEDFDAAISAGGGGGGSDLVQVASGAGSVRIPGILVPDRVPASPNAADDEFDALSGWTTYGTPNANVTDAASLLHLSNASPGTFQLHGIYKAVPSMPFTVTARLNDTLFSQTYQSAFLMLLETGPGKVMQFGPLYAGSPSFRNLGYGVWASRTSRSSFTDNLAMSAGGGVGYLGPLFIRLVVTSSTNIATSASFSGLPGTFYSLNTGINPGFTVAYVGLGITGQDNNVPLHAYFDWIRFS